MKSKQRCQFVFSVAVSLCFAGCSSLPSFLDAPTNNQFEAALRESPDSALFRAIGTAKQSNAIVLQVEGEEKPFRIIPLPKEGQTVFMNDLLRQAGLLTWVSTLDVALFRTDGQVMDGVKMAVTIDPKTKQVSTGTDYALRPGDRVTVRRTDAFQDFMDGVLPPMAKHVLNL